MDWLSLYRRYPASPTPSVSLHPHTGSNTGWGRSGIKLFRFCDDSRFFPLSERFWANQKTFPAKTLEAQRWWRPCCLLSRLHNSGMSSLLTSCQQLHTSSVADWKLNCSACTLAHKKNNSLSLSLCVIVSKCSTSAELQHIWWSWCTCMFLSIFGWYPHSWIVSHFG